MYARRKLLVSALRLFDLALMIMSFIVAALVALPHGHRNINVLELLSIRVKIQNFAIFSLFVLVWHGIFGLAGLHASRRLSKRRDDVIDIIRATSLGTFVILAGAVVFHIALATPLFLAVFWVVSTFSAISSRLALQFLLATVRQHGRNVRNMLIIGTNRRALNFARMLVSRPELGYRIIGFADQDWTGMSRFQGSGYSLASDFGSLPHFLRNSVVDEVTIALPFRSMHDQAAKIAATCEEQGITVRVLNNIFDVKVPRPSVEDSDEDPLITYSTGSVEGWQLAVKRIVDFTISLTLLAALFPALVVIAILIKMTSRGPVFFVQKRLGLNKRHFNVCKFRTMVVDAEKRMREVEHLNEVSGPVFKIKNDPRVTAIGKLLRKTSIDELPQLFNVLKGDMSLVGPRPLPIRDYEGFNEDWQRRRFSVKPGITCLWQILGRSSIPFEKWMQLDLQYIDKWSLWLDFKILLQTIPAVLRGSGAA